MPKFYNNKEEQKKFLESHEALYRAIGYNTPEKLEQVIEEQLNSEAFSQEHYDDVLKRKAFDEAHKKLYDEKYWCFAPNKLGSNFYRIAREMYRPETSAENIQYNTRLANKLLSREGSIEVLQEAVAMLGQVTPALVEEARKDPRVLRENYHIFTVGFVAKNLLDVIGYLKANHKNEYNVDLLFPPEVVQHIEKNKLFFEELDYFRAEIELFSNVYHHLIPLNLPEKDKETIYGNLMAAAPDTKAAMQMVGKRVSAPGKEKAPFTAPDEKCMTYFKDIRKRMKEEQLNHSAALEKARKAEKAGDRSSIFKSAKCMAIPEFDTGAGSVPDPVKTENKKLLKSRVSLVEDNAWENYKKPFAEAADEMVKIVEDGNMITHSNPDYKTMLTSIRTIAKISHKGNIRDLSMKDKQTLYDELLKLDKASESYRNRKYQDEKPYSPTAVDRLYAASMCSAFVVGRMVDVIPERNKDIAAQLAPKALTKAMIKEELAKAKASYKAFSDLESFVEQLTYTELGKKVDKGEEILNIEAKEIIDKNYDVYKVLYEKSETFRNAVKGGNFKEAREAIRTAVSEMQPKKEQQKEIKEPQSASSEALKFVKVN